MQPNGWWYCQDYCEQTDYEISRVCFCLYDELRAVGLQANIKRIGETTSGPPMEIAMNHLPNHYSYSGQDLFIGVDVHKRTGFVTLSQQTSSLAVIGIGKRFVRELPHLLEPRTGLGSSEF